MNSSARRVEQIEEKSLLKERKQLINQNQRLAMVRENYPICIDAGANLVSVVRWKTILKTFAGSYWENMNNRMKKKGEWRRRWHWCATVRTAVSQKKGSVVGSTFNYISALTICTKKGVADASSLTGRLKKCLNWKERTFNRQNGRLPAMEETSLDPNYCTYAIREQRQRCHFVGYMWLCWNLICEATMWGLFVWP